MSVTISILIFICSSWGGREEGPDSQAPSLKRSIADGNNLMSCDSRYINRNVNSQLSPGDLPNKTISLQKLLIVFEHAALELQGGSYSCICGLRRAKLIFRYEFTSIINL